MSEDLNRPIPDKTIKSPIPESKILKNNPLGTEQRVPKIIDTGLQYKADDGSYHPTTEGLQQANEAHFQQMNRCKSSVLGRVYPATAEGAEQMRKDEASYWESQKIDTKKQG